MSIVGEAFVALRPEVAGFGKRADAAIKGQLGGSTGLLTGALSKIGAATVATGAVVAAASIKMAGDFQQKMTQLVTTAGETQKNIGMVSSGILAMAPAVGTSAQTLASGMYTVESAGYHGAAGLAVLKAGAEGAKAEGADLSTVVDALTSTLNAYHLKGSHAVSVTNQMLAAVSAGKMHFQDLASSLSAVLPVAAASHVSFAQVGGAIATMTAQGMSAQQATQDLAHVIGKLQSPSQQQMSMMQQLGLSVNDVTQNVGKRGLTGTLDMLVQAVTSHMGPAGLVLLNTFKQSQAAAQDANVMLNALPSSVQGLAKSFMDGTETQTEWRKALKNVGSTQREMLQQFAATVNQSRGFNDALKSGSPATKTFQAALQGVTGDSTTMNTTLLLTGSHMATFKNNVDTVAAAAHKGGKNIDHWNLVTNNFNFMMDSAKAGAESLAIGIGTKLLPVVSGAIRVFASAAGWIEHNRAAAMVLAGVVGGVLSVAVATFAYQMASKFITAAAEAIGSMVELGASMIESAALMAMYAAEGIAQFASWAAETVVKVAVVVATNVGGAAATAAAWVAANAVMLLGIGLVVVALAAIGFAIYEVVTHWHTIERVADEVWHKVLGAIEWVWRWIRSNWPLLLAVILAPFTGGLSLVVALFLKFHTQILAFFSKALTWLERAGHDVISGLWNGILDEWRAIGDIGQLVWNWLLTAFKDAGSWLIGVGKDVLHGLAEGLVAAAEATVGHIPIIGGHIVNMFKSALGVHSPSVIMHEIGRNMMQGLANGITDNRHLPTGALGGVGGALTAGPLALGAGGQPSANAQLPVLLAQLVTYLRANTQALQEHTTQLRQPQAVNVRGRVGGGGQPPNTIGVLAAGLAR